MIIKITKLERGSHTTAKGNNQTGLYVYGTKVDQQGNLGEDWDKFIPEQYYADQIAALEKIGVGNGANIRMQKNGNFWNIAEVTPYNGPYQDSGGDSGRAKSSGGSKSGNYRDPDEIIRTTALNGAISFLKSAMDFQVEGKATLFPITKLNLELLADKVEEIADRFTKFIKGKIQGIPESTTEGLKEPRQEPEEPITIPDDDIPF